MKEITRIHLAKISYDVEVQAKKDLEAYLGSLETYMADQELLDDIEIRITELLAERGVMKGGVISSDDIEAIRQQLGEPSEFMTDNVTDDMPAAPADYRRRLYRDADQSILGGVLSGVGAYFGLNPVWVRLLFVVLLLASFGTAFIVYVVLWIVLPVARTATEKLQLAGRPVTLQSIRELNAASDGAPENKTPRIIAATALIVGGIVSAVGALAAVVATIAGGLLLLAQMRGQDMQYGGPEVGVTTVWLMVASGLLLATLCLLVSYAFFARKVTKRMVLSGVAIVILGSTTFGFALGGPLLEARRLYEMAENSTQTTTVPLTNTKAVTKLVVATDKSDNQFQPPMTIEYVVDAKNPRYTLTALPGLQPRFDVTDDTMTLSLATMSDAQRHQYPFFRISDLKLTVYGPALTSIDAHSSVSYTTSEQAALQVTARGGSFVTIAGAYKTVTVTSNDDAVVELERAVVQSLRASLHNESTVTAGVLQSLSVTLASACAADADDARVTVEGVTSGKMTINDTVQPLKTYQSPCGTVQVQSDEEDQLRD